MACGKDLQVRYKFNVYFKTGTTEEQVFGFTKVSGLDMETEVQEWRTGDDDTTYKIPGQTKSGTVTMERGYDNTDDLNKWYKLVYDKATNAGSAVYCKEVKIEMLRRNGDVYRKWSLTDAWPSKYTPGDLDSNSAEPAVESIELQHSGVMPVPQRAGVYVYNIP